MKKMALPVFFVLLASFSTGLKAQVRSGNVEIQPSKAQLPAWLERGKIRFARLDGGPIEAQKTERSLWGEYFTPRETEVLGNLYTKYADRMVALLKQAHVNFVWVTYSVGFSWQDERQQRAAVREIVDKLHRQGIHVAAYICAVSIFWQSMFRDVPQSVRWIMFSPQGLPYRYSGGRDPLRFTADLTNPNWISYQEKRVGAIVDDGLDTIFFDNTGAPEWASNHAVANFFTQIRQFLHDRKHSGIPLFSNFGLSPSRAALNRYMNFTYDEGWRGPGVWGADWDVSNIRRDRLLQGMLPLWKPVITEYSIFHQGNRSTGFLGGHAEKLSIAEAAAFGTAYTWDMEGPFDAGLIARNPKAMDSWSAISHYNAFLENHSSLYVGASNVTPLLVLIPDGDKISFAWPDAPASAFFDFLSRHSILYSVKPANGVTESELKLYSGIVVPFFSGFTPAEKLLLRRYKAQGGRIYAFAKQSELAGLNCELSSPGLVGHLKDNSKAQQEVLSKLDLLAPEATRIAVVGTSKVLANVTSLDHGNRIVLHLINYDPKPGSHVRFRLSPGRYLKGVIGEQPKVASPDAQTSLALANVSWKSGTLQATLPSLGIYAVISLQ